MLPAVYRYYRDIIPGDETSWQRVLNSPLPLTAWVNTMRITVSRVIELLKKEGIEAGQAAWHPDVIQCAAGVKLGAHWLYKCGLLQIQEAVSMLAGYAMAAEPHERCLDLCAAPGNKTAQIALMMKNTGTVIGNDINYQRMKAFGQITKRLGIVNASITIRDASSYPRCEAVFDRVMVDAPCSCEGTFRKGGGKRRADPAPVKTSIHMANTQVAILRKALSLCKPGGRIVYSTCTFSPIENEGVLTRVLATHGSKVSLIDVALPMSSSPGVLSYDGEVFHPSVVHAHRLWPHQNNTGGFFIAVLEKAGDPAVKPQDDAQAPVIPRGTPVIPRGIPVIPRLDRGIQTALDRFDFPDDAFANMHFHQPSSRGVYCLSTDHCLPTSLNPDAMGLFFLKTKIQHPKLSTGAVFAFGHLARRHIVNLDAVQRTQFIQKEDLVLAPSQLENCDGIGYVIVRFDGLSIGLGLLFPANSERDNILRSLFPKSLL